MDKKACLIGAAIDACGNERGAALAPQKVNELLRQARKPEFAQILEYNQSGEDIASLAIYYQQLALLTKQSYLEHQLPIVVGGDHSCAIGTWSGIASALKAQHQSLGLMWFDAHMDSHTPQTTQTGNIHGMPVATLLGFGYAELTSILENNPKILPQNVVLFGIRCYESGEAQLLKSLGVKVYYSEEVNERGLQTIFQQEWQRLAAQVDYIGLSIDLDGFDPKFTPGVSTPVAGGIDFNHFLECVQNLDKSKLAAVEITEGNPRLDVNNQTIECLAQLIEIFS